MSRRIWLPGLAALLAAIAAAPASARVENGDIAFRRFLDPDHATAAIFTIGVDGSGERQLTRPAPGQEDDQPDWSPDGSRIIFDRCAPDTACGIYTVKPDGSALTQVNPPCSSSGAGVELRCEDGEGASFLPNGRRYVYTRATGAVRELPGGDSWIQHSDLVVRRVDGTHPRVLVRSRAYHADLTGAKVSPDGRRLVWVQVNSPLARPAGGVATFVANADGTHRRRITPWSLGAGDHPDWSPDSTRIVLRSHDDGSGQQSQIYVVRPDGTGLRQLTHVAAGTTVLSYAFSPDGTSIVLAMSGQDGEPDLYVMRVDGTALRQVTRTPDWDSAPDWGRRR